MDIVHGINVVMYMDSVRVIACIKITLNHRETGVCRGRSGGIQEIYYIYISSGSPVPAFAKGLSERPFDPK